jgi:glycosyltransferase involved in cell wall biosynthesis
LPLSAEDPHLFSDALVRILSDPARREELAARSRTVYQQQFSWHAISARFARFLNTPG